MANKKKVELTNKSIKSNIPELNFAKSLNEYIWNGFDAGASIVEIFVERNILGGIELVKVKDNGNGIDFNDLKKTFETFSDSMKAHKDSNSEIKGEKGKGRFYFINFCRKAEWLTVYQDRNTNLFHTYKLTISSLETDKYDSTHPHKTNNELGTEVIFTGLNISEFSISHTDIEEQLASEFGPHLYLNKDKGYKIVFDNRIVTYLHLIQDSQIEKRNIEGKEFKITYLQWKKKIGERSFIHFSDENNNQKGKFISKCDDIKSKFYHSVYVESDFYNEYNFVYKEKYKPDYGKQKGLNTEEYNKIYVTISTLLDELVLIKHKKYIDEFEVNKLIYDYKVKGIIPNFENNKYDHKREEDLVSLIKGIYIVEPAIFKTLNNTQAKTMVGLFNLLLSSDSRESILDFLTSYTQMSEQNRIYLHNMLKITTLEKITQTTKMIIDRLDVIERLKILIFDYTKFTTERNEIQKIIENNYWLFGEEFNLVSADKTFNHALYDFLIVSGEEGIDKKKLEDISDRRPDILLCSNYITSGNNSSIIEENLIIELKRPSVNIGEDEYRQLEDYKRIIFGSSRFNSTFKKWKFYIIGKDIKPSVKERYESAKISGVKGLTNTDAKTFEIYALTWEDLFTSFRIRYRHILETLGIKEQEIINEIEIDKTKSEKEIVQELTSKIINIKSKPKNKL